MEAFHNVPGYVSLVGLVQNKFAMRCKQRPAVSEFNLVDTTAPTPGLYVIHFCTSSKTCAGVSAQFAGMSAVVRVPPTTRPPFKPQWNG
jgi:hypothetical protein